MIELNAFLGYKLQMVSVIGKTKSRLFGDCIEKIKKKKVE